MKKNNYLAAIFMITLLLVSLQSCGQTTNLKLGYMNINKVFNNAQQTKDNESIFANETKMYQEQYANLLKKSTDSVRVNAFKHSADSILSSERERLSNEILYNIDSALKVVARNENYDMIFNSSDVIYVKENEKNDVTDKVLIQTNLIYDNEIKNKKK